MGFPASHNVFQEGHMLEPLLKQIPKPHKTQAELKKENVQQKIPTISSAL